MPEILRPDGTLIRYQAGGEGEPVLALAPGGVSSAANRWHRGPIELADLGERFRTIAMDQRHAGGSRTALKAFSYDDALGDQLAVLGAEGVQQTGIVGAGIGATYALRLAYDAPARVRAVVLIHPIGIDDANTLDHYYAVFNETIRTARAEGLEAVIEAALANPCFIDNPAAGPWAQRLHDEPAFRDAFLSLGRELYITLVVDFRDGFYPAGKRFFSVNDIAIERIRPPILVVPGEDDLHPPGIAEAICASAPSAEMIEPGLGAGELMERVGAHLAAA